MTFQKWLTFCLSIFFTSASTWAADRFSSVTENAYEAQRSQDTFQNREKEFFDESRTRKSKDLSDLRLNSKTDFYIEGRQKSQSLKDFALSLENRLSFNTDKNIGPSGSGGGNEIEALFTQARMLFFSILSQADDSVFSSQERSQLLGLADVSILFQHSDFTPKKGAQSKANAPLLLNTVLLQSVYGELTLSQCLDVLIFEYSTYSNQTNASQASLHLESKLLSYFRHKIRMPQFLDMPAFDLRNKGPQDKLPGCRDRAQVIANPWTAELTLYATSSQRCIEAGQPEFTQSSLYDPGADFPELPFQCQPQISPEADIICSAPRKRTGDFEFCLNKTLDQMPNETLTISKIGIVQARFFWCNMIKMDIFSRALERTYLLKTSREN